MDLLNKIHVNDVLTFIDKVDDNYIDLTITSPPFYAEDVYIIENDKPEFGWRTYKEYLNELKNVLMKIYKKTVDGGRLCLILSNTYKEKDGIISEPYPIVFDIYNLAVSCDWMLMTDAVWSKTEESYLDLTISPKAPESVPTPHHDWILVFRKKGIVKRVNKAINFPSVWTLKSKGNIQEYNLTYNSFPDELVERILHLWSVEHDIIFDPFAGSGQVIRIAKEHGLDAFGCEIDKKWEHLWSDINSSK